MVQGALQYKDFMEARFLGGGINDILDKILTSWRSDVRHLATAARFRFGSLLFRLTMPR